MSVMQMEIHPVVSSPLNTATRSQYHEERSVFKEIQKIQSQI